MAKLKKLPNVDFNDCRIMDFLNGKLDPEQDKSVEETLIHLGLCHTLICEVKNGELVYNVKRQPPDAGIFFFYAARL